MKQFENHVIYLTFLISVTTILSFGCSCPKLIPQSPLTSRQTQLTIGTIVAYLGDPDKLAEGWLVCDGRDIKIFDNIELFDTIGWRYGRTNDPNDFSTFKTPDLRGKFLRSVDSPNFSVQWIIKAR
jgi:hypothetical protein